MSVTLPGNRCVKCKVSMEMAIQGNRFAGPVPKPRQFAVCGNCGAIHCFKADLTVRLATLADRARLSPEVAEQLATASAFAEMRRPQ